MAGPNSQDKPYTFDRVVRLVLTVVGFVAVLVLLRFLSDVLLPFAAAVVLAYLLNPMVTLFEQKTNSRRAAVGITLVGIGIVGSTVVVLLVPLVLSQAGRLRDDLTMLRQDLAASLPAESVVPSPMPGATSSSSPNNSADSLPVRTALGWQELKEGWKVYQEDADRLDRSVRFRMIRDRVAGTYIGESLDAAIDYAGSDRFRVVLLELGKRLLRGGWSVVAFTLSMFVAMTGLIVVLLYLVFLLLDFPEYARTWPTFLPPHYRDSIVEFLEQFNVAMRRYFRGQSLIALCMGVLFSVGFTIIGLPMAVPLGLFIGLLNMVPYLQMIGLIPAAFLAGLRAIELDAGFLTSIGLTLLVFAVAQLIQDALIVPRIMGKATGLRPVAVLLGVFVWGKLLGFLGLILAIPLTCLGIAYYRRFVLYHSPQAAKKKQP